MILSTQGGYLKWKFMTDDLMKEIQPLTFLKNRSRKDQSGVTAIEDKAIDEEDKAVVMRFIEDGSKRAYEVLTFLTNDVPKPYSWKEAGTESQNAVVYAVNKMTWMANNLPVMVDMRIKNVIVEYALYNWFRHTGAYDDVKIHYQEYDNAIQDLRTSCRLRNSVPKRPNTVL